MENKSSKKDNINKLFIVVCIGVLLLIIVFPARKNGTGYLTTNEQEQSSTEEIATAYYENRLKEILENTYGSGTMDVMVHMNKVSSDSLFYSDEEKQYKVDGVLVVAHIKDSQAVSDITFAVCALFDLPAHKVAVMIKK